MAGPILCLVDLENHASAQALLKHAVAHFQGREMHVAYILPFGFYSFVEPYISLESQKAVAEQAHAELDSLLSEIACDIPITPHVLRGGIGEQALRLAGKLKASVIVLNAVRSDSAHITLGTNAAQICRHAGCSVHLVRHDPSW